MRNWLAVFSVLAAFILTGCDEQRTTPPPVQPPTPPAAASPAIPPVTTTPPVTPPEKLVTMADFKGRIGLMKKHLDLGPLPEGAPKTGVITIANGLDQPVEIRRVAGDCSCVKWEFKGFQTIPAQGSLQVLFTLKPVPLYSKKKLPFEIITSSNVTPRIDGSLTYECVAAPVPTTAAPPASTAPGH